jgi:uncharacterized protein YbjT (DUF2867 family)
MFVVTGAAGNTGSIVARQLMEAGRKVRLLVRDPRKVAELTARGAEVVVGDLWDPGTLARALAGAEGLYLLSPPDATATSFVAQRRAQLETAARVVRQTPPGHVVFLSSIGAQHEAGTGPVRTLHAGEQALRATGLPVTFVRAAYFVDNVAAVLPIARKDGVLPTFIPAQLSVPMVSTRDIGAVAARALLDGPRGTRIIELGGPTDPSPADLARALTGLLGRTITVAEPPLEAVVPTFRSLGFSEDVAGLFRELYEGIRTGKVAWEGQGTERQRGTTDLEGALRPLLG